MQIHPPKTNMDTQNDDLEKGDSGFTCGHIWYSIYVKFLGCIGGNFDGFALKLWWYIGLGWQYIRPICSTNIFDDWIFTY